MQITLQNIPFFCLLWIGLGFILVIVGVFILAFKQSNSSQYTEKIENKDLAYNTTNIEELFSFFLQEEEKKNNELRDQISKGHLDSLEQKSEVALNTKESSLSEASVHNEGQDHYAQIIQLYNQGIEAKDIAKQLKMGKGEVELIISLYMMR